MANTGMEYTCVCTVNVGGGGLFTCFLYHLWIFLVEYKIDFPQFNVCMNSTGGRLCQVYEGSV